MGGGFEALGALFISALSIPIFIAITGLMGGNLFWLHKEKVDSYLRNFKYFAIFLLLVSFFLPVKILLLSKINPSYSYMLYSVIFVTGLAFLIGSISVKIAFQLGNSFTKKWLHFLWINGIGAILFSVAVFNYGMYLSSIRF